MNKMIAWISIILFSLIAVYFLFNRQLGQPNQMLATFTKPHNYTISYPRGWLKEETGQTSGYEILSLYSFNYRAIKDTNDVFSPGQIKIALSILDKGNKSLAQIADLEFTGIETEYRKEFLEINGHQAIRVSAKSMTDQETAPRVEMLIDYKDNQYALLIGYYAGDKNSAGIIDKIQQSFTDLK